MTTVAVLGAGSGGLSATVELSLAGHSVRLWNRSASTLVPVLEAGAVRSTGVLGDATVVPGVMTTDLGRALDGVDCVVVALPSLVHHRLFCDLAQAGWDGPTILNPGHTGGALHLRAVYLEHGRPIPPVAEFSTLTYVARNAGGVVNVTGRARSVRAGALPGGTAAIDLALELFPGASPVGDVVASSLSNVNVVLHPPGAVLGAAWVEATEGDFTFYVEGMTPGVGRVMAGLDLERRGIARAFGHDLPSLVQEMVAIGTVEEVDAGRSIDEAVRRGVANSRIKAPDGFAHRYYLEDLPFGLVPMIALAQVADVDVPIASSLLALGSAAAGIDALADGLNPDRLGIAGLTLAQVQRVVTMGDAA